MQERNIVTQQGTVYYWISENWNDGNETIFFFPGLTADHTMFDSQVIFFEGEYNIIVWDAPCHGKSRPYSDFSFENTSNVILQILHDHQVQDVIAVGQSLGGYYVQAFILRHSEKVKAFIGIGTTPYGETYYSKVDKFWLRQVEWIGMCYPLNILRKAVAKETTRTVDGYQNMMKMIEPYKKKEFCHLMQIAYDAFLKDNRDMELKCPVLITYGEYDRVGKVRQYCKMWNKGTNFPLIIIKNAGHNANVDNPAETNQVIIDFIEKFILK